MEILIKKNDFLKGLQKVQGIVDAKKAIPILSNVLIELAKDGIWIYATDLEVGIKGFYPGKVTGEGSLTLPGRKLFDIVRELPNEEIIITCDNDKDGEQDKWIKIVCGKYQSRLPYMAADVYPSFPSYGDDYLVSFDPVILKDTIRKTIFSISSDTTRLALNGTLLEIEENFITMVSTDGHRLSYMRSNNAKRVEKRHAVIISRKTSTELLKFADDAENQIIFGIYENHAVFRRGKTVLVSRLLIDGQFPNYNAVIPGLSEKQAVIKKESLVHALRRVSLLSEEKSRMVKLCLTNGKIELESNGMEIGEARENIEVDYAGEPVTIGLNAKYVLDILAAIDEDKIRLSINDSTSPAMFLPNDDENYKCVIMPVRLQS